MIHHMAKQSATSSKAHQGPRTKSAARSDWRYIGAEVPGTIYDKMVAEAHKQGVAQAVIIRWAMADYFAEAPE